MPFEVFYETPIFSENGVAHSIHNSTGIQGVNIGGSVLRS